MATTYKDCIRVCAEEKNRPLSDDLQRPMTQYESQIVYGLYSFPAFVGFARDVMHKRNKRIPRAVSRIGLIQWACMSLYRDYVAQLTEEGRQTFYRRAHNMQLTVTPRRIQERTEDGWKFCRDRDVEALANAAWRGTCQYCALKGMDARKCRLRKTLDGLQCLEPGDNPDCWYRAD